MINGSEIASRLACVYDLNRIEFWSQNRHKEHEVNRKSVIICQELKVGLTLSSPDSDSQIAMKRKLARRGLLDNLAGYQAVIEQLST
jgi:hypothetical protein